VANTQITGTLSVANTAITGNIISSQIAPSITLYGNPTVASGNLTVGGSTSLGTASASGNTSIYQAPGSSFLIMNVNGTLAGARRNWAINPEYDVAGGLSFNVGASEGAAPSTPRLIIKQQGALVLSNGSTSVDGTGITFPATQNASSDANTLDDYEEGTFTPTAFGSTTAGTTTYQVQQGSYIKIGKQVTISVRVGWTAFTGTGELIFGSFPFASANDSMEYMGAVMTADLNWGGGTYLQFYKGANNTTGVLFYLSDDAGFNSQQCVSEASSIRFTVTYFTA